MVARWTHSPKAAGSNPAPASMMTKEIIDNQLFVYYQGRLIYKRWIWRDRGQMFHGSEGLTQWARK